jgi:hypothetical protein
MIHPSALQRLAEERTPTKAFWYPKEDALHGLLFGMRRTDMDNEVPKYVTQERAALLLGIPEAELRRISRESELGHTERAEDQEETFFTYEELRQISLLSTHQLTRAKF